MIYDEVLSLTIYYQLVKSLIDLIVFEVLIDFLSAFLLIYKLLRLTF